MFDAVKGIDSCIVNDVQAEEAKNEIGVSEQKVQKMYTNYIKVVITDIEKVPMDTFV